MVAKSQRISKSRKNFSTMKQFAQKEGKKERRESNDRI